MRFSKKSQFSMEYLLTIVVVISLFIPVLLFAYYSAMEQTQGVEKKQLETLGNFFLKNIEKAYSTGVPTRIQAKERVPVFLKNITAGGIRDNDVVFVLDNNQNFSFSSNYPLEIHLDRTLGEGIIEVRFDSVYKSSEDAKKQIVNITILD